MTQDEQWLLQEKYGGEKTEGFFTDSERLKSGEPLAYIIGSVPFLDTTIYLDSHPLIPRSETEFWTEKAIESIRNYERHYVQTIKHTDTQKVRGPTPYLKVLDLCAGSGCVGVAVAKAIPSAQVDFGEIDPDHLLTIKKNIQQNLTRPSDRLEGLVESDLFSNITKKYNFILTNPPYIDPTLDRTQLSVKNHEPHLALYGGVGGMEIIEKIIEQAKKHLTPNGQLWIEHEPEQVSLIQESAKKHNFLCIIHNDQHSTPRYSVLTMAQ